MNIDYIAIAVATIAQFAFGALWYMPLFGKEWGKIHGFDAQSPETKEAMKKGMMPLLAVQLFCTLVTSFVFALLLPGFPAEWNIFGIAGFFWLGFIVPTQVGAVIFGGTKEGYVVKKIAIMTGAAFFNMMILAAVFSYL